MFMLSVSVSVSSWNFVRGNVTRNRGDSNSRTYPWAAFLKVNGDVAIKTESDGGGDFKSHGFPKSEIFW